MNALVMFFLGMVAGLCYGFILGCLVGAIRGPAFCRGVVEGFMYPWRCFRRRN